MLPWELCPTQKDCHYLQFQLTWTIGVVVGAALYGSLITLGISCMYHLHRQRTERDALQRRLLRAYIFALLLANTIYGIENFIWANYFSIFYSSTDMASLAEGFSTVQLACTVTIVAIGFLTDGLMVWRCYMVQKMLVVDRPKIIRNFFWVFPACIWMTTIVTGTTGGVLTKEVKIPGRLADTATTLLTTALVANICLNMFATIFMITRLTLYRRFIRTSFGTPVPKHHVRVVGMLLESAAINIPVTIVAVVGIATWSTFGDFMMSVVVPGQSFASILVIYQVAIGKAVGESLDIRSSGETDHA